MKGTSRHTRTRVLDCGTFPTCQRSNVKARTSDVVPCVTVSACQRLNLLACEADQVDEVGEPVRALLGILYTKAAPQPRQQSRQRRIVLRSARNDGSLALLHWKPTALGDRGSLASFQAALRPERVGARAFKSEPVPGRRSSAWRRRSSRWQVGRYRSSLRRHGRASSSTRSWIHRKEDACLAGARR